MRADLVAEVLIVLGIMLLAVGALLWLGPAAALGVLGVGAVGCGVVIGRGGIGR